MVVGKGHLRRKHWFGEGIRTRDLVWMPSGLVEGEGVGCSFEMFTHVFQKHLRLSCLSGYGNYKSLLETW